MKELILPKRFYNTNDEDPTLFYRLPLVGSVYRKRLENTLKLTEKVDGDILDIGYGSGLLFPSLLKKCRTCYGFETHGNEAKVYQMLENEGIAKERVVLAPGSILAIPAKDDSFDEIVCVSTLEHIPELDKAMAEMSRVLKQGGKAVFSFPVRNIVTDWFYRLVGYDPRKLHPSSHRDIIAAAERSFKVERTLVFPQFGKIDFALYCTIKCVKN
jgi:ubiquinone/menaquinone biosynthesis C-methylase UbiE